MRYAFVFAICLAFVSCDRSAQENARFEGLANRYIQDLLQGNPDWATNLGDHRYDGMLTDMTEAGIQARLKTQKAYLDSLTKIDKSILSEVNRIDCAILMSNIEAGIYGTEVLRSYTWNPMVYNIGRFIYPLIARDFAPL